MTLHGVVAPWCGRAVFNLRGAQPTAYGGETPNPLFPIEVSTNLVQSEAQGETPH